MAFPEGKIEMEIDAVSQNRLNTIEIVKFDIFFKKMVLGF